MDFVAGKTESNAQVNVRANVFLRMRDLTHRANNDSRLLVATMHADLYPVSAIRGKCRVKHRDLICNGSTPELAAWKRRDDHFYYYQLYDRYIHRFYDVIPSWKVKNAPDAVLETLREKYSFIVAEVGISSDLCDALRGCAVCKEWAPSAESVRCDTCHKYFHMRCVNPPLQSKPAKGYSWSCATCTKKHDAHVEEHGVGGGGLNSESTPSARGSRTQASTSRRTNRSHLFGDVPAQVNETVLHTAMDREGLRCFQGWPYRYFGEYTSALDVLDSHDSIYPRAVTRCGTKYQMAVPSWEEQQERNTMGPSAVQEVSEPQPEVQQEQETPSPQKSGGRKRKSGRKGRRAADTSAETVQSMDVDEEDQASPVSDVVYERGGDETVTPIYVPSPKLSAPAVDEYLASLSAPRATIPRVFVAFMDRGLELLCANDYQVDVAAKQFAQSNNADFGYFKLSPKELESLEKTLRDHSAEMSLLKRALPDRTPGEIVKSIYYWQTYVELVTQLTLGAILVKFGARARRAAKQKDLAVSLSSQNRKNERCRLHALSSRRMKSARSKSRRPRPNSIAPSVAHLPVPSGTVALLTGLGARFVYTVANTGANMRQRQPACLSRTQSANMHKSRDLRSAAWAFYCLSTSSTFRMIIAPPHGPLPCRLHRLRHPTWANVSCAGARIPSAA